MITKKNLSEEHRLAIDSPVADKSDTKRSFTIELNLDKALEMSVDETNKLYESLKEEEIELLEREKSHRKKWKKATNVRGKHYSEWAETIDELKRDKKHKEAIELLLECVEATERENDLMGDSFGVAPAFYRNLAIIYRKEKKLDKEIEILERYKARAEKSNSSYRISSKRDLLDRLDKINEKNNKKEEIK